MNMGIVTSFIVGGLLLLAMLQFNNRVLQNSAEMTMSINEKNNIGTIRQVISQDFNMLGFGVGDTITVFNPPNQIRFTSNVYNQGNTQVMWNFQENAPIPQTSNPNDRRLMRVGPVDSSGGTQPTVFNVVDFELTGYSDIAGTNETTNRSNIRSISVKIVYEAPESVSLNADTTYYPRAVWSKHFVPNNLQFN